jgi:hypothetical protein
MGELIQFSIPPKLGRGERPKRRSDADRLADLAAAEPNAKTIAAMREIESGGGTSHTGSTESIFAFAKEGEPKVPA